MKKKVSAKITQVYRDGSFLKLTFSAPELAREAKPGQFLNVRVSETLDPLLRRPFSIHDVVGDEMSVLISLRGKGTEILSEKKVGDELNILGNLGNFFPEPDQSKTPVFIAGGVGIAPFLFFARSVSTRPKLLFGARKAEMIPDLSLYEEVADVEISTEDGSRGVKGSVLDIMDNCDIGGCVFYACGPEGMLRAIASGLSSRPDSMIRAKAYFSLETYMACGFGACKGCAVETSSGEMKLACQDGPIFPWNEVVF